MPLPMQMALALALWLPPRISGIFFMANGGPHDLTVGPYTIKPGGFTELKKGPNEQMFRIFYSGEHTIQLAGGTAGLHTGLVADSEGCRAVDANDLQTDLARAAVGCPKEQWSCMAKKFLGGLAPEEFIERMFQDSWNPTVPDVCKVQNPWDFWDLCVNQEPSPALRSERTRTGHDLEVFREFPMVASVRGFASEAECQELITVAKMSDLTMAHVGSAGQGFTQTSSTRETLTNSLDVNWNVEDTLSLVSARTFDLASDLLGVDVPYEGQEPLTFLHYIKGYEYRPHIDGNLFLTKRHAPPKGTRIATTLLYCGAADEGGATVFTNGQKLKFQPRRGDVLFFAYNPDPETEAMHAACPVLAGNKTTLTQWHRLGVSSKVNWDSFADWGKFYNPHQGSEWKGSRFSVHGNADR